MDLNSSIDLIILDKENNLILIKRENEPYKNQFSLIGGAQLKFESFENAIERILKEKAGLNSKIENLKVKFENNNEFELKQLKTYDSGNDSKGVNTTLFLIKTNLEKNKLLKEFKSENIEVFEKDNLPQLAFEHNKFISNFFFHDKNYTTRIKQDISITIDLVIFTIQNNFLKILLSKRSKEPFSNHFSLPGGFVNVDKTLDENAQELLKRDTNIQDVYLEQLYSFGNLKRDPRGRVISIGYYALINSEKQNLISSNKYSNSNWISIKELKNEKIAFDHKEIIEMGIERIKNKIEYSNIAFQLLPEKFTLAELQEVYETILDKKLDKRNFRKKIAELEIVEELNEFKKQGRMRPAKYYRFLERSKETPLKAKRWI